MINCLEIYLKSSEDAVGYVWSSLRSCSLREPLNAHAQVWWGQAPFLTEAIVDGLS